jgi:hypothetical protein
MQINEVRQSLKADKPSFDELKALALGHLDRVLSHYSYERLANFYFNVLSLEAVLDQLSFFPCEDQGKAKLR